MPSAQTVDYGTEITLPAVPTKTGYTGKLFIDDEEVTDTYIVTDDTIVTAVYTINEYTVTFKSDETDVTMPEEQKVKYNETLTLPQVPNKTGYTGKWFIDGKEVTDTYVVTDDVTVKAVYTINQYTITYKTNEQDVTMPNAQTVDYGTVITLPTVPAKTGYTGEWQIDNKTVTGKYTVTDDVTVMAVYTINQYTVTYKTNEAGVTMPNAQTVDYGTEITLPTVPTKTGYTGEWQIDDKTVTGKYTVTDDVTVMAVYTINQYTVTYKTNEQGVTMPNAQTVDYGTEITLPTVPAKTGYTGEWQIDDKTVTGKYTVTDDVTVMAVYTINQYTITYKTNEQGVTMPNAQTVDYGTEITLPTVPAKTGYTGEWQIDNKTVTGKYTVTDNVTVMAVYTINQYTVTYKTNEQGVTMPNAQTVDYGTEITLPTVPAKTGYTGEWQIDNKTVTGKYTVTEDVTVIAEYTINEYTVTFTTNEQGVTGLPIEKKLKYNTVLKDELPAVPDKEGYTGKWTIEGQDISDSYVVTEDVTVIAEYTINEYTVTFTTDEQDVTGLPIEKKLKYNTVLKDELPAVPEKEGYTGKWTIKGQDISDNYVVTEDVTVIAEYTINEYTVTFTTEEQGVTGLPIEKKLKYNTVLKDELPAVPDKEGYTGVWTIDGKEVTDTYIVTDDVTVIAVYTINEYTVTFTTDEQGVTGLPIEKKLKYNTVLKDELPAVPGKEGYTGVWTIDGKEVTDTYIVTDDVTVTAVYTIMQFTVTYECDEAEPPEAETVDYGTVLTLPAMEERTGYTGKWTIDGEEIPEGYEVKSDLTVKFEYVINTYEIKFECDYDDVTMPSAITAEYGTPLSEALADVEMPEKPWYNGKWTVDGADITANDIVEDDVIVTAVYKHIEVRVYVDYVGGYSDGGNFDPSSVGLYSYDDSTTFEYDITAEELQIQISEWKNSASNYYTVAKAVYLNDERSLSGLDNPFDIEGLPEITENTLVKDIAYDYEYEGTYQSFVRIYLVPAWENVHKVTFHDVDGKEIESQYTMGELLNEIPTAPENYTWVYTNGNDYTEEFTQDTWIGYDTDVYCGCKITVYEYTEGAWETVNSVAIQIGGALTEDNIRRLTMFYDYSNGNYFSIAGFAEQPVSGNEESIDLVTISVGQTVEQNIDLYIVKAKIDYTTQDGNSGTLYWLGDGSLMEKLNALRTSTNYVWHFDSADGDIVSDETLGNRMNYDYDNPPDSPQTAARFTVVEA